MIILPKDLLATATGATLGQTVAKSLVNLTKPSNLIAMGAFAFGEVWACGYHGHLRGSVMDANDRANAMGAP